MTLVYAHRGASHAEPENTIAAFERAVAMGSDGVELDVRRTSDDRLVVHHDPSLPDGRAIRATRAADLPDSVPALDDALDACGDLIVNIEIKNAEREPDFDPTDWVAVRVATMLAGRPHPARWLISSFRYETVERFATLSPGCRTAWLTVPCTGDEIERAAAGRHAAIHPSVGRLDRAGLRAAHAAGLAVNVWTCDEPGRIAELMAWGVDGICTNVPDAALEIRRRS